MRHLKMLTVAAMAVFALAALVGASTASATRLCATNSTPCNSIYGANTTITGTSNSAQLTTSGGFINPTITCTSSSTSVNTNSAGGGTGTPVTGTLTAVDFNSCSASGATCSSAATVANGRVTSLGGAMSLSYTSLMNGNLTLTAPVVHFTCTSFGLTNECYYGGNSITGSVTGGNPASIAFNNVTIGIVHTAPHASDSTCPTAAHWTATYTASSPTSIFVSDS